jgi:hypothetical protein
MKTFFNLIKKTGILFRTQVSSKTFDVSDSRKRKKAMLRVWGHSDTIWKTSKNVKKRPKSRNEDITLTKIIFFIKFLTERVRVSGNPTTVGNNCFFKPENPLKLGLEKLIQNIENPGWETYKMLKMLGIQSENPKKCKIQSEKCPRSTKTKKNNLYPGLQPLALALLLSPLPLYLLVD